MEQYNTYGIYQLATRCRRRRLRRQWRKLGLAALVLTAVFTAAVALTNARTAIAAASAETERLVR
jgi:hypothetical protein